MINPTNILTVLKYDGAVYTNVTTEASDTHTDIFTHNLDTDKFLYVGYDKPINAMYIYMATVKNTVNNQLVFEYYNGTTWTQLSAIDQTSGLKRNGIINWTSQTDQVDTVVNGLSKCWIRVSSTAPTDAAIEFSYIGLVFSDDTDIGLEFPSLLKECFYPTGQSDFMGYHISAKEYIMSELLRKGYSKIVNGTKEPINQWDVLDIYELRQASLYYALSQIFFNLSDNSSDNYWQKYLEYKSKYDSAMNLGMLRIDQDNDGQIDASEAAPVKSYRWVR